MRITDTCSEWIWFLGIVGLGVAAYNNPNNFVLNLMAFVGTMVFIVPPVMDWADKRRSN